MKKLLQALFALALCLLLMAVPFAPLRAAAGAPSPAPPAASEFSEQDGILPCDAISLGDGWA